MPENSSPIHSQHTCKSCNNSFTGFYCNLCGEKIIEPKDRKFKTFLTNVIIATTVIDNKFLKSLWLIISRPGFLSREYVDGRKVMYMRPLQVFFILNLIYFLFPVLQMFNSSLYTQKYILPHKTIVREVVAKKINKDNASPIAFELLYNEKTTQLAKLFIVIFVLIAALPLSLIFIKGDRYFADHTALSVELTCFNLAVNTIFLSLVLWPLNKFFHWSGMGWERYLDDMTLTFIFISTNLYFLFYAGRIFYRQKGKVLIVRVIFGILGLFVALEVYKFILFFITIWSM